MQRSREGHAARAAMACTGHESCCHCNFASEGVNESGVPDLATETWPIQAQSKPQARAMASICNDERECFDGMSGCGGFVHTFSDPFAAELHLPGRSAQAGGTGLDVPDSSTPSSARRDGVLQRKLRTEIPHDRGIQTAAAARACSSKVPASLTSNFPGASMLRVTTLPFFTSME